jgi:hypothetical protein
MLLLLTRGAEPSGEAAIAQLLTNFLAFYFILFYFHCHVQKSLPLVPILSQI